MSVAKEISLAPKLNDSPIPNNESARVATLLSTKLLDSDNEDVYDCVTRMAKVHFNVPVALFSLVDTNRQWFKSKCGIDASETSRDISFCAHTIMSPSVMVILDALKDERFKENSLVTNDPKIRFYAGAPIIIPDGIIIGTLCLIDTQPKAGFSNEDQKTLTDLASVIAHLVELRLLKLGLE